MQYATTKSVRILWVIPASYYTVGCSWLGANSSLGYCFIPCWSLFWLGWLVTMTLSGKSVCSAIMPIRSILLEWYLPFRESLNALWAKYCFRSSFRMTLISRRILSVAKTRISSSGSTCLELQWVSWFASGTEATAILYGWINNSRCFIFCIISSRLPVWSWSFCGVMGCLSSRSHWLGRFL